VQIARPAIPHQPHPHPSDARPVDFRGDDDAALFFAVIR